MKILEPIKTSTPSGYIFVLVLMLMTVAIALSTQIYNENTVHNVTTRTMIDRQRATILAQGGVQVAMSSLLVTDTTQKEKAKDAKEQPPRTVARGKKLLTKLLPVLNRWQTFKLTQQIEGIDATLQICIMCEEGKFNPNWFLIMQEFKQATGQDSGYDKIKKEFEQRITNAVGFDVAAVLNKFFNDRKAPLLDVTELLTIKEFGVFKNKLFYQPPSTEQNDTNQKRPIYLLDLFTTEDWLNIDLKTREQFNPWLLSNAWCTILGLQNPLPGNSKERKTRIVTGLKEFKDNATWSTDWDKFLKPIYQKDFASLPKGIEILFNTDVNPKTFSVLSRATIGTISQQLYAVFQLTGQQDQPFVIKRMYWL